VANITLLFVGWAVIQLGLVVEMVETVGKFEFPDVNERVVNTDV
jgi:hypothetical protein